MQREEETSRLIRYTLNFSRILVDLESQGATREDLDTLTSQFYKKAIDEAAHNSINKEEAFRIILSVFTGGAVVVPGRPGERGEREWQKNLFILKI